MKHRRISKRRAALAGAGVLALLGSAAFAFSSANATPTEQPEPLSPAAATELADRLTDDLGGTAGSYYDAGAKKLVVNVVNEEDADAVRAEGAEPRLVDHTLAQLNSARQTLKSKATIPGTSWSIDPKTNKVQITADRTVKGAKLERLTSVVESLGSKAEINRSEGEFQPFLAGGDAIWGGGSRCSVGFNVVKDGQPYFLTAGHCGDAGQTWSDSQGGAEVAATEDASFPGNDYALVEYTAEVEHPSAVNLYNGGTQNITTAGEATVGQQVQRSGSTTQVHDGEVTGLNETVNYQQGSVEGLIKTTVCAEPGDSGGALFAGETALGITSGGSGDCTKGGTTFFQPVAEALTAYGAQLG